MDKTQSFWLTPKGLAALALVGAAIYFLLMEHRTHFFTYLPFLILLLCPVMHLFMHGGHGHGGHGGHETDEEGSHHHHSSSSDNEAYRRGLEEGRKQSSNISTAEEKR